MIGIELTELFSLGRQLGFALSGAAALWGFVFARAALKRASEDYVTFARTLLYVWAGGFVLALVSWLLLGMNYEVFGHEGVVLSPSLGGVVAALELMGPLYLVWALLGVLGLLSMLWRRYSTRMLLYFYGLMFALSFVLISFPVWTGSFSGVQLFFAGHSFHSIFTVGTVLVLDLLFLLTAFRPALRASLFSYFPTISKVIWVGLGFDFLSVALVFPEALALTPKFFFMQTVIGILIVNGIILSGSLTRALMKAKDMLHLPRRVRTFASVCGAISISSWLTITIVDAFAHLTLSYGELIAAYIGFILFVLVLERLGMRAAHRYANTGTRA